MNVAFRPCTPADIATLWQFSCEPELGEIPSPAEIWRLAECFAEAMLLDGELAACGGIALDWPGRGVGWVLARPGLSRRAWAMATRRLRQAIAQAQAAGVRRIEARVHDRFAAGCILVRKLGFEVEAHKPLFWPSGAGWFEFALLAAAAGRRDAAAETPAGDC